MRRKIGADLMESTSATEDVHQFMENRRKYEDVKEYTKGNRRQLMPANSEPSRSFFNECSTRKAYKSPRSDHQKRTPKSKSEVAFSIPAKSTSNAPSSLLGFQQHRHFFRPLFMLPILVAFLLLNVSVHCWDPSSTQKESSSSTILIREGKEPPHHRHKQQHSPIIAKHHPLQLVNISYYHQQMPLFKRHRRNNAQSCEEGSICSSNNAHVCRNNTCVSACALRGLKECRCSSEEDNYCYLCCGSESERCAPAHEHRILRNNGERWERESCARCRMNGAEMEGLACDDKDPQRLCLSGKCSRSVCSNKQQGEYCDRKQEKICVDDVCENPCARIAPHLMVCDCPSIDPDTGFASEDRCQLCCFDFNLKPTSRRCQNAYRKFHIESAQNRPIWRVGLECAHGKRCNRYGQCSAEMDGSGSSLGSSQRTTALVIGAIVVVFLIAALITRFR